MKLSEMSLPVFVQMLNAMSGIIDKAAKHAAERKYDPASLLQALLFPNMYSFARQIQALCDWPIWAITNMTGKPGPKFDGEDKSFDDLKARIAKSLAFIQSTDIEAFDASAEKVLDLSSGANKRFMKGKDYVVHRVLPQFYFHMTTAYGILRTNGLDLSKGDYMGKVPGTKTK